MEEEIIYFYNVKDEKYYQSRYTHRWLNNLQQQCKKQKEVIDKMNKILQQEQDAMTTKFHYDIVGLINALLDILKEVSE